VWSQRRPGGCLYRSVEHSGGERSGYGNAERDEGCDRSPRGSGPCYQGLARGAAVLCGSVELLLARQSMEAELRIQFRNSNDTFRPAERPGDDEWIDTSFSQSPRAVGGLRLPGVNNGRYESKHPILDTNGATVGFMVDGQSSLGYTFTCVYAADRFWIAHQGFGATMGGGGSSLSLVGAAGTFLFSSKTKFKVVKSFDMGGDWVVDIRAFRLLEGGDRLLYLTSRGVCLFDTRRREVVARADFDCHGYARSGFALSPKVALLAMGSSERGDQHPLDGERRYSNSVRIYDLESGDVVGEQALPGDREMQWAVDFSEDGRMLQAASGSSIHVYELVAKS